MRSFTLSGIWGRIVGKPYLTGLWKGCPSSAKRTTSALSDKILPKMLKTYCSPIEILLYMGIQ